VALFRSRTYPYRWDEFSSYSLSGASAKPLARVASVALVQPFDDARAPTTDKPPDPCHRGYIRVTEEEASAGDAENDVPIAAPMSGGGDVAQHGDPLPSSRRSTHPGTSLAMEQTPCLRRVPRPRAFDEDEE